MKTSAIALGLLAAGAAATPAGPLAPRASSSSLPTVSIKGNAFFAGGKRFYIRGVDYQPGGSSANEDPIANADTCKRDVAKFKELGLNTIRVYTVDNSADHDECMQALADAGIYLALDVNNPLYSINRDKPAKSYNKVYLQSVFATIDAFQKYDNTLMFFSGNEVINSDKNSNCAPYVKATDRDMRSYINARGYRKIPVGYSAADVAENRMQMAQYMNCGPDGARSDFFAFNDYSWCDPDTFEKTDWSQKAKNFSSYSIPLFLSEYGCKENTRTFNAVSALYDTSKMTPVYSGGLVYEYTEEKDNAGFGLVTVKSDTEVTDKDDFTALKKALSNTPAPTGDGGYKTDGSPSKCPTKSSNWDVDLADDELPAMPDVSEYFKNGAGTAPGLKGGSQEAGEDTVDNAPAASGAVTTGASESGSGSASPSGSKGAAAGPLAPVSFAPMVCGLVVLVSSLFGGSLLL
ncbi:1,3-beta-glucanosyltransferase [Paraconiothyrium brasiliense]|uniref:1,3-beta-glucanosyltransferase n=1 Tax=Paraconiothyrium brasiliense TaxID=300254 RepID=A0ABR3QKQ0_9PLEO